MVWQDGSYLQPGGRLYLYPFQDNTTITLYGETISDTNIKNTLLSTTTFATAGAKGGDVWNAASGMGGGGSEGTGERA